MSKNVLEGLSHELACEVEAATDRQRRVASLIGCKLAVNETGLDDPLITEALEKLEAGVYQDPTIIIPLERLVARLDNDYLTAKELYDKSRSDADCRAFRTLFSKARAAEAVVSALNGDSFIAATHSLHEVCAIVGSDETLELVRDALCN